MLSVRARLMLPLLALVMTLGGCTAINLGAVVPPAIKLAGVCAQPAATPGPRAILVPSQVAGGQVRADSYIEMATAKSFKDRITQAQLSLPTNLQGDPVVLALSAVLYKASAKGQLSGLKAANFAVQNESEVDKIVVPGRLTHGQLVHFVKTMLNDKSAVTLDLENNRVAMLSAVKGATIGDYLNAYYGGNYYDVYGTNIAKPTITMTISDQAIANVLSVFLDYMLDSLGAVPVLTSDATPTQGTTTFYIGGNKNMPTALALKLATFQQIPASSTKCQWTAENASLLGVFANTTGDEAGTVSGLVSQSAGGFEVGLGFLGKISIGDNQTLGIVVKTAASRAANRAALAALYWAVESRRKAGG